MDFSPNYKFIHWLTEREKKIAWILQIVAFTTQAIHGFSIDDAFLINALTTQLVINYVLCHFVTGLTWKALSVANIIYDTPWYELPKSQQNAVSIILQRAQKPFYLSGMGILDCSLETYLNVKEMIFVVVGSVEVIVNFRLMNAFLNGYTVNIFQLIRAALSYFMIFRTLNESMWVDWDRRRSIDQTQIFLKYMWTEEKKTQFYVLFSL